MMRSIRFGVFAALMLAAPAAMAKPVIIDHRDHGPPAPYVDSERVPADYRPGYGWMPIVHGISASKIRVGEQLIIRGARFRPNLRVFLAGQEMQASITPTQIRFTVPRGSRDGDLMLRVPGMARPLMLGTIDVLGRWDHRGFLDWAPVQHQLEIHDQRMDRLAYRIELAQRYGREGRVERLRAARRAEIERFAQIMDRLWAEYFARPRPAYPA